MGTGHDKLFERFPSEPVGRIICSNSRVHRSSQTPLLQEKVQESLLWTLVGEFLKSGPGKSGAFQPNATSGDKPFRQCDDDVRCRLCCPQYPERENPWRWDSPACDAVALQRCRHV